MWSSSSLLLLLFVVLAAVPLTNAGDLASVRRLRRGHPLFPTTSEAAVAPLAVPTINQLYGCYSQNGLQCAAGVTLGISISGLADTATVAVGPYTCANPTLNGTGTVKLHCTLPTDIQPSDYGVQFNVSVTTGGQTSASVLGVTFVHQPILPTVTSIAGCAGGEGTTAYACREGQTIYISGTGFYYSFNVKVNIGPYSAYAFFGGGSSIMSVVPAVTEAELNTPLPVTVSFDGNSGTYTPGVSSYGPLILNSVTGCGVTSGPVTGCNEGDVLTLTGSGFNLGTPGDVNILVSYPKAALTVVSNTIVDLTLPAPPASFTTEVYLAAGPIGQYPPRTQSFSVAYATVVTVLYTGGLSYGCARAGNAQYPTCHAGDQLYTGIVGDKPADVSAVTIISPSGHVYECGSPYANGTYVVCEVPVVSSADLGKLLGVTVTAGGTTSAVYSNGLVVPLA